jgi:hypothetical protein
MSKFKKPWSTFEQQAMPDGSGVLYHNNRYHVILRKYEGKNGNPDVFHLSIRNNDRSSKHDWREFQRIKNEIVGLEAEMVEVYPKDSLLVDSSNQYHLWGFLSGDSMLLRLGIGFESGRFVWDGVSPKPRIPGAENAVQRPMTE